MTPKAQHQNYDPSSPKKPRFPLSQNFRNIRNRIKWHTELVDLPKTGPLTNLPAEIQLEAFSYLDFHSFNNLRSTCRYYRHFISKAMIEDARIRTITEYKEMELQNSFVNNNKPCYTCLRIKHQDNFHNSDATRIANTIPLGDRYCISCGLKNNKFQPGQAIKLGVPNTAICKHCKRFQKNAISSSTVRGGFSCRSCDTEVRFLLDIGPLLRFIQGLFALIIFALACSGRTVPRSSHFTHGNWRWIYTIAIVLFTLGSCTISFLFRLNRKDGFDGRDDDYTFSLPIELLATLGWAGVFVGLVWEGTHPLYEGEFDKIGIALTVMSCLEFLFFFLTLTMCSSKCVRHCVVKEKDSYS